MGLWYDEAVFYHIYPLGATGAPKENHEEAAADRFSELNQWIPCIKALGCTAVYIGPLFEASTHGYDTRDFRTVDRRLGTNAQFKDFVTRCHEAGIRVVVDGVFNHTGREFFAFRDIQEKKWDSPYKDWYRGVDFSWQSPFKDAFGYEAWQGHFELPVLNHGNHEVRKYLLDSVGFWIREFDIDGIRLDCANVLDFEFMKALRHFTDEAKADFWLMGEVIHGQYSRWANKEMLHSVTNYELHKGFYSGCNDYNLFEIAHTIRRQRGETSQGVNLYTFLDNHDEDRIASKLKNMEHLKPVYAMLLTLPGIPSIYYGSEWGISGRRSSTCDEALRPAVSWEEAVESQNELTEFIREWIHIHRENEAFHNGDYRELVLTNRQFAFLREKNDSRVIVAINLDSQPASLHLSYNGEISLTLAPYECRTILL